MAISVYKTCFATFGAILIGSLFSGSAWAQAKPLVNSNPSALEDPSYLRCAARVSGVGDNAGYKNPQGRIGLFQFDLYTAQKAGLCSNPVPFMRNEQVWKLCDFKGPIALKYQFYNEYDFRYDGRASQAQFEMMRNLNKSYDDIIYEKKYDRFFNKFINGVLVTPSVIRGLIHANGSATVSEFFNGHQVMNRENRSAYSMGVCLHHCMASGGKDWLCGP